MNETFNELERLSSLCTKKIETNHIEENNLVDINKNHRLYDCSQCSGMPGGCPNYVNHEQLLRNNNRSGEWIG